MIRAITLILLCLLVRPAVAQDLATLVADSVTVQSGTTLMATGHVEAFFKGQSLKAEAIAFDQAQNRLSITGPIRIDDGRGTVFLAEQAELSADMTEGLLTSARLVLNQQLQLAAANVLRSDGGSLTAMRQVVASSCTICAGNSTPLWEIRAREVVHDGTAHQIFFNDAVLRFYGLPVLYVPILRMPDPDLNRATGFLIPKVRSTTALGTGLKLPYFVTLGASRDLTLTPYLSSKGSQTLGLRYRQAFANGTLQVEGSASHDTIGKAGPRGYLTAQGNFDLGNAFNLSFSGISVSDDSYLVDYGVTGSDRLESRIALVRIVRDLSFSARILGIQSLRDGDSNRTLPTALSDLSVEKRFDVPLLGGAAGLHFEAHSDYRRLSSSADTNGDGVSDGRDLVRISLGLDWNRNWVTPNGIVVSSMGEANYDGYTIQQDALYDGRPRRVSGAVGLELRWPWVKSGKVTQTLEPIVQLVTSGGQSGDIPNSDSTLVEFDEGNLFALDRFPGADAVESGTRLNIGLNYRRDDPGGWSLGVTAGRVVRLVDEGQFSAASGLDGTQSDWLLAWSLDTAGGLSLTNRLTLDDGLELTKGELRFDYGRPSLALSGGFEYLLADSSENRSTTNTEIKLGASTKLAPNLTANVSGRYDIRAARLAQSGLQLDFRNECIDLTFSLSRSYASSSSLKPSTDVGLSVELLGFGGGSAPGPSRICRR